ncbi:MAG: hypothetical protein APG12_00979 [Candidatus Methanofastidiosum methylothiophilum]|uniref:DUF998 domain-containing protein n=1 Tax=Candidatus Methanofastidiosum methylothiophilum TaxID=1705564 RepID=A0A150IK64_9EURY|nr:MAG: hypothetical protein APG10_01197 [Candidatus Methanofastidiosum methylthiophilus]KYC47571.1 MAG: hypothetical protein APG11_01072 [Candidatus Methanofastidiosum methylthiophilus]KYC50161.1 MAG: hypothetical protein APG12_00979 [Candidatus Methanofastidiosum methylthiophilus]
MSILSLFRKNPQVVAGTLLFLAGSIAIMGIITAEIFYPSGYTTSNSEISDLGSTRPPNSIIMQPSATIFNSTMIITGIMTLISAYCIFLVSKKLIFNIPFSLFGLGVLGVGIFPGNIEVLHPIFALITFISGGIAAITSSKILDVPFKYISILFGIIALFFLFSAGFFIPIFGDGGTERWVAYPIVMWLTGFGGYLLGNNSKH